MAVNSLSKTDDTHTQNRKIREQMSRDNAFTDSFADGASGYN